MLTYSKPFKRDRSQFYYCRTYDRDTGRRGYVSTNCTALQAATEWRRTREMEQALGKDRIEAQEVAAKTFGEAFVEWLEEKRGKVGDGHLLNLELTGSRFWLPAFGKLQLAEITPGTITKYLSRRRRGLLPAAAGQRRSRPVAAATANGDRGFLRRFFTWCRRRGWLRGDPLEGVGKFSGEARRRTRYLSPEEELRLLAACRGGELIEVTALRNAGGPGGGASTEKPVTWKQTIPAPAYLYPLVLVGLRCGFRRRTLMSLRWRDLDSKAGRWIIPAELMKTARDYEAPVPQSVLDELRDYRQRLGEECIEKGTKPDERLEKNAKIFGLEDSAVVRRAFLSAAKRADLSVGFHDMRRIFLNRLRERGVSIETAMALTGHKSLAVVMAHYREVPEADLQRAVQALDLPYRPATPGGQEAGK
ncbi:MAG: tyrosine-type recombinase/integrase [Planctomycetes bacterium]|nr:tyrosine-type recombinase/integrase [Planctomycetota bacterium]